MKYRRTGAGAPVLFLHGIPTSGALWQYVVQRLQTSCECVVVDLPGFGESQPLICNSLDPGRIAVELEALREELKIEAWHVVGHDAGAAIAVEYAAGYPDRMKRLALLAPPIFPDFRPPWFFRLLRMNLIGSILAPFIVLAIWNGGIQARVASDEAGIDDIFAAFRKPFAGWRGARRLTQIVRWGDPRTVLGRVASRLERISVPTLVMHGRRDGAIPARFAEKAAAIIPHARLLILDTGHFLPLERPADLSEHLRSFLIDEERRSRYCDPR